jgi:HAD superfamily hydrolase (TIGR01549 family)
MLDISAIRAIGLDLDDTLWPVWPAIEAAERAMQDWLAPRAPRTAALFADVAQRMALRQQVALAHPGLGHDLSALRRMTIAAALRQNAEDEALADAAFEVFFEGRMRVTLYEDALPALESLARHYPIVAISNGNADVHRVGLSTFFRDSMSAQRFGAAKPDVRIFAAAAATVDVPVEALLHVGDDPALDVLGGLDAGAQTVWLNRARHEWPHARRPHAEVADLHALCRLLRLPID